jgi:hypothetical protein
MQRFTYEEGLDYLEKNKYKTTFGIFNLNNIKANI